MLSTTANDSNIDQSTPWNKGKLIGQKPPLKLKEIWAIRIRLQLAHNIKELALFNLAIDSKLRGCDLVKLQVRDIAHGNSVMSRAMILQQKTRESITDWIQKSSLKSEDFLFPSRIHETPHITTRHMGDFNWVRSK